MGPRSPAGPKNPAWADHALLNVLLKPDLVTWAGSRRSRWDDPGRDDVGAWQGSIALNPAEQDLGGQRADGRDVLGFGLTITEAMHKASPSSHPTPAPSASRSSTATGLLIPGPANTQAFGLAVRHLLEPGNPWKIQFHRENDG
jgi:hypothetical protein